MKVISIQQPWATLIMIGAKRIETRSWATKYRGPILIHASATMPKFNRSLCDVYPFTKYLTGLGSIPTGVILGKVELKEVYTVEYLTKECLWNDFIYSQHERQFGDYTAGRYGWVLSNIEMFNLPIPAKGQLGLWTFPDEFLTNKTQ